MAQDRIQWEDIPEGIMEKWVKEYGLEKWPFRVGDKHNINRDKAERIYSEIHAHGGVREKQPQPDVDVPKKIKLPKDPDLLKLYDILREARCAVFNDEKMKNNIGKKTTTEYRTCEFAVNDINRFIKSL